ncbi:MAG: response regulator [Myxococcales bacterium]|nr:response regulator [Myxococcales bacterium]
MSTDERPLVLYVDDEAPNRLTFSYLFEDDLRVVTLGSGEEALAQLDELQPALLVADQRMPGMSGSELCGHVRERRPDTIRVILTAYADLDAAVAAINRGAVHAYLQKPYADDALRARLNDALNLWRARREVAELEARVLAEVPVRMARLAGVEIAHELSNVLTSLGLSAQVLDEELHRLRTQASSPAMSGAIERSLDRSQQIITGVEQLIGFTTRLRAESVRREACDAGKVARSTLRLLESQIRPVGAGVLFVGAGVPKVAIAQSSLGQALINLVLNAVHALERAGRRDGRIELHVEVRGDEVCVQIVDDGPGIPPQHLEHLFDRGFSTGGNGLGLNLTRRLLEEVDGRIEVESEPGRTVLSLFLPPA